jgi:hypothetical protein
MLTWFLACLAFEVKGPDTQQQTVFLEQWHLLQATTAQQAWQQAQELGLQLVQSSLMVRPLRWLGVCQLQSLHDAGHGTELHAQLIFSPDTPQYLHTLQQGICRTAAEAGLSASL